MQNNIKEIFSAITPDNIKNIPVVRDQMDIFIEILEELSKESIDIRNAFENTRIKEELIKIYLDDLYTVFKQIQFNQSIDELIEKTNAFYGTEYYKKNILADFVSYINEEHFLSIKSFKENKGTTSAIEYIYELVLSLIETNEVSPYPFTLIEKEPFNFKIKGSMNELFYENIVRPLAHPLGFTFTYERIIRLLLEDFYPESSFIYDTSILEIRCLKGTGSTYSRDFLYDSNGNLRTVHSIESIYEGKNRKKRIYFKDGTEIGNLNCTYLEQVTTNTGQTKVYYKQSVNNGTDTIIEAFEDQCSIYFEYNFTFRSSLIENTAFKDYRTFGDSVPRLSSFNSNSSGYETGMNYLRNEDGSISGSRQENYYSPSSLADIKILLGKYKKNVQVFDNFGNLLGTEPIHYTDTVESLRVNNQNITVEQYNEQNTHNAEYFAKEYSNETHSIDLTGTGILYEIVGNKDEFIDFNGNLVDLRTNCLNEIGSGIFEFIGDWFICYSERFKKIKRVPIGKNKRVNKFRIGYSFDSIYDNQKYIAGLTSPEFYIETEVNYESVNLQFFTTDEIEQKSVLTYIDENEELNDSLITFSNSYDSKDFYRHNTLGRNAKINEFILEGYLPEIFNNKISSFESDEYFASDISSEIYIGNFNISDSELIESYSFRTVNSESDEYTVTSEPFLCKTVNNESEYYFEDIISDELIVSNFDISGNEPLESYFGFGVYRNNVLLQDNNYSAWGQMSTTTQPKIV